MHYFDGISVTAPVGRCQLDAKFCFTWLGTSAPQTTATNEGLCLVASNYGDLVIESWLFCCPCSEKLNEFCGMTWLGLFLSVELERTWVGMICLEMRRIFTHEITQDESLG